MKYYLYNPLANNGIRTEVPGAEMIDASGLDYAKFFGELKPEDEVVLIGGDGTVNYLVNHVDCENLKNKVYLLANGTGNDFLKDIGEEPGREILLNPYLKNLPTVRVNGLERKFINNMGFIHHDGSIVLLLQFNDLGQFTQITFHAEDTIHNNEFYAIRFALLELFLQVFHIVMPEL